MLGRKRKDRMKQQYRKWCGAVLFPLALLFLLAAGCGNGKAAPAEQIVWTMTSAQSAADGRQIAVASEELKNDDAVPVVHLTCTFDGESFCLRQEDSEIRLEGDVRVEQTNPDGSVIYSVRLEDGTEGYAVSGVTSYEDGEQEGTFLLCLPEVTLNFRGTLPE